MLEGVLAVLKWAVSGFSPIQLLGVFVLAVAVLYVGKLVLHALLGTVWAAQIPTLHVQTTEGVVRRGNIASMSNQKLPHASRAHLRAAESQDKISAIKYDPSKPMDKNVVPCYDPATMQLLGHVSAMSAREVCKCMTHLVYLYSGYGLCECESRFK